jgi:hypothetical protein
VRSFTTCSLYSICSTFMHVFTMIASKDDDSAVTLAAEDVVVRSSTTSYIVYVQEDSDTPPAESASPPRAWRLRMDQNLLDLRLARLLLCENSLPSCSESEDSQVLKEADPMGLLLVTASRLDLSLLMVVLASLGRRSKIWTAS